VSDRDEVSVDVAVSPEVAFDVFTREIDAWYRVDTVTLPDITRTAAIRFEPRLGGRLLDVHDLASGEGRELGRITAWEPGRRLAFTDNEGSEVDVSFEPAESGTRVTLVQRGPDGERAGELRRAGWAALAPLYRDHLVPNARALGVVLMFSGLAFGLASVFSVLIAFGLGGEAPAWLFFLSSFVSIIALVVLWRYVQKRWFSRWVPAGWDAERFRGRVVTLMPLALVPGGVYLTTWDPVIGAIFLAYPILMLFQRRHKCGPACGRSLRKGVHSAFRESFERHRLAWNSCILAGILALMTGLWYAISAVDPQLFPILMWGLFALAVAIVLRSEINRRRLRRALGSDPDLYLAVERRLWEQDRPPRLLVHRPDHEAEHSGWHAYASEQDEGSRDLLAWSLKDLVDQSPEAARPLREGRGKWIWDQAERAYRRVDPELDHSLLA